MTHHPAFVHICDCARFQLPHFRKCSLRAKTHRSQEIIGKSHPTDVDRETDVRIAQKILLEALPKRNHQLELTRISARRKCGLWRDVETLHRYIGSRFSNYICHLFARNKGEVRGGTASAPSVCGDRWTGRRPSLRAITNAKYSSRLGMANLPISELGPHDLDSPQHTAISDRNSRSCAIAYPRNGAARPARQRIWTIVLWHTTSRM